MDDPSKDRYREYLRKQRATTGVKSFIKKIQFDNLISSGVAPNEAARRIGIRIRPGRDLPTNEILKLISRGKFRQGI